MFRFFALTVTVRYCPFNSLWPACYLSPCLPSQVFLSLHFLLSIVYSTAPVGLPFPTRTVLTEITRDLRIAKSEVISQSLSQLTSCQHLIYEPLSFLNFFTPLASKTACSCFSMTSQHLPPCPVLGLLSLPPLFKCQCVCAVCLLIRQMTSDE